MSILGIFKPKRAQTSVGVQTYPAQVIHSSRLTEPRKEAMARRLAAIRDYIDRWEAGESRAPEHKIEYLRTVERDYARILEG